METGWHGWCCGPSVAPMEMKGYAVGVSGRPDEAGSTGPQGPESRGREERKKTYLLMYSPVRMTLQVWHLKQLTCHCLSRASSDWPCLISSLQPAQSEKTGDISEHTILVSSDLPPSLQTSS